MLGSTLAVEGRAQAGPAARDTLERALKAFRASLEFTTWQRALTQWRVTQKRIVFAEEALTSLGEETDDD
jgi:hypothetical protein